MRMSWVCKVSATADRNSRPSRACARMWGFAILAGLIWLPDYKGGAHDSKPFSPIVFKKSCQ